MAENRVRIVMEAQSEQVEKALDGVRKKLSGLSEATDIVGKFMKRTWLGVGINVIKNIFSATVNTQRLDEALRSLIDSTEKSRQELDLLSRVSKQLSPEFYPLVDSIRAVEGFRKAWSALKLEMTFGFLESSTEAFKSLRDVFQDEQTKESMREFGRNLSVIVKQMAKLGKYMGLRSIHGTMSEGAKLAQQELLDWDKFLKASFFERQRIVDQARIIKEIKSESANWRLRSSHEMQDIGLLPSHGAQTGLGATESELTVQTINQAAQELADGGGAVQAAKQATRDIAVVTEQARDSFIETREVGLGVYDEWITAQAKWIEEQDRAVRKAVEAGNDFANGWRAGLDDYVRHARDTFRQAELLAQTTAQSMQHSFSDFFFDAMRGQLKGFEDYLNSFVVSVQRAVADMTAQRVTGSLISGFGGLFSAHGNVFDRGQVLPFASGGVVSSPTLFPLGIMGEAGPEAILPLQRTRSGDLGVRAAGSDGGDVINNYFALNISAMDTRSMSQAFDQHKRQIVGMVQDAYNRRGQRGPLR